ncbi:LPXTG cell wall anchor domain containing protein [Parasponia andersonii]|uniref:LPXTG cell wall anchor domain containing protein n=1 Tax=Parasponia andersonii TaxID=3476 RepID=A0A2P5D7R2_PARAD|nr:LPXTG cell wall anchor domain containing protein [Parasponia andersonii]
MAAKLISKLSLYIIVLLLSLTVQTSAARRSEMLPLPNNTAELPLATNDAEVFPQNDKNTTQTTDYNDPDEPLLFTLPPETTIPLAPKYNSESSSYYNPEEDTESTNDGFFSFATPSLFPPALAPLAALEDQNDVVFSREYPDPEIVSSTASPPPYYDQPQQPPTLSPQPALQDQNDVVFPPEFDHDDSETLSVSSPTQNFGDDQDDPFYDSPVPVTAPFSDDISPSEYLPDYGYSPVISPVFDTDYDDNYYAPPPSDQSRTHPEVFPFTYEADDEVDPELAEDIQAYNDSEAQGGSGTVAVALGAVCLIGIGGFIYKKRKNEQQRKSQYEYLNKRDIDY